MKSGTYGMMTEDIASPPHHLLYFPFWFKLTSKKGEIIIITVN